MSQDRLKTVMAMPEAKGRKALAQHLATATDMTPKQMRACLAASPSDPLADARDIVRQLEADSQRDRSADPPEGVADESDMTQVDTVLASLRASGKIGNRN